MKRILNTLNSPATGILCLAAFCAFAWVSYQEKNAPYDTKGLIAAIESSDRLTRGKSWDKQTQAEAMLAVWEGK